MRIETEHPSCINILGLNTTNNTFYPQRKPNNKINYLDVKFNLFKTIINAIPKVIE